MSMSKLKGKRVVQCSSSSSEGEGDGSQPEVKRRRQALASYYLTAIKEDIKQEIRLVVADTVREEIRLVVADTVREVIKEELQHMNSQHSKALERNPSRSLETGDSRSLQLHFKTLLSSSLYTGKQIEGVKGASILIALIDANTGSVVESGPEASIKLDVVVLEGDFNKDNSNDWTRGEFESYQMREREGKAPLLVGDLQVTLKGGVGELGKLKFTDNSSWNRSKMYRIGLKVASGCCEGIRIREAITEALRVKDHRGESYEKQYPAKPDDEVWRLKNIARDGVFHKRLRKEGVEIVEDLLREFVRDSKSLRNVLGGGMTDTKWADLIDHAKSCVQGGKLYLYSYAEGTSHAVVFNITGQLKGYTADGSFFPVDSLPDSLPDELMEHLKEMVGKAYDDWGRVKEFNSSIYSMQNPLSGISSGGAIGGQQDYLDQSGCHLTSFDPSAPSELPPGNSRMVIEGYNETEVDESLRNTQNGNPSVAIQNPPTESINLPEVPPHQNSAPTEPYLTPPNFDGHSTSSLHLHEDQGSMENFCSTSLQVDHENEARMFESWIMSLIEAPSPNLPRPCRSRTAVVSWLRIKAVFKWGFFVRRKVTSKVRPTIEQLN